MTRSTDRIPVSIIGVGIHGRRYANHVQADVPGLDLRGIYQRSESDRLATATELGVVAHDSVEDALSNVDAVIIVTPPSSHADLVRRALSAGKWVLVEKPVTRGATEADAILALDAELGGRVMVAHTLRYDPILMGVKARLSEVAPIHYVRLSQRLSPSSLAWQRDLEVSGGGSIILTGVHLFDTARWLLEEDFRITSCVREHVLNPVTEDFFHATGRTDSGIHLSMEVSKYTTHRASFIEVVGQSGQLLGDYHAYRLEVGRGATRDVVDGIAPQPTVRNALRDFERWMRGEIENPIPLSDGVRAVAAADQCYEAGGA